MQNRGPSGNVRGLGSFFESLADGLDESAEVGDDLLQVHGLVIQGQTVKGRDLQPTGLDGLLQLFDVYALSLDDGVVIAELHRAAAPVLIVAGDGHTAGRGAVAA